MKLRGQARERADQIRDQMKALERSISGHSTGLDRLTTASRACKGATLEISERAFAGVVIEFGSVATNVAKTLPSDPGEAAA